ncbi:hypothetical protein SORBI_3001G207100 [Sorghum bicolor]|uniref:Uncharacterized protein n=1 Tax=Sorghum bicolor TaxID=4558 RepID=A0A1B6QK17_SORBI|nr:hypothetical protein SORBI_3001G207100 [Sorghum bicolor]
MEKEHGETLASRTRARLVCYQYQTSPQHAALSAIYEASVWFLQFIFHATFWQMCGGQIWRRSSGAAAVDIRHPTAITKCAPSFSIFSNLLLFF